MVLIIVRQVAVEIALGVKVVLGALDVAVGVQPLVQVVAALVVQIV